MKKLLALIVFIGILRAESFDDMLDGLLTETIPQISTTELAAKLAQKDQLILLDTRERKEFEISHLEGALCVGYKKLNLTSVNKLPKDTEIIVYCSIGKRSEIVGGKLKNMGFVKVKNLRGGIFQWANERRTIRSSKGKGTNSVHPYNTVWGKWLKRHVKKRY